jgi:hypothetical protein
MLPAGLDTAIINPLDQEDKVVLAATWLVFGCS